MRFDFLWLLGFIALEVVLFAVGAMVNSQWTEQNAVSLFALGAVVFMVTLALRNRAWVRAWGYGVRRDPRAEREVWEAVASLRGAAIELRYTADRMSCERKWISARTNLQSVANAHFGNETLHPLLIDLINRTDILVDGVRNHEDTREITGEIDDITRHIRARTMGH